MNAIRYFKSKTIDGRLAKTYVVCVEPETEPVISIHQRILVTKKDIENGDFSNAKIIKTFKNYTLVENRIGFLESSFMTIVNAFLDMNWENINN